jgi:hypothetical protein
MNSQVNDVINQNTEYKFVEEFHVDEERQLIAMTREGLISVINTAISACADKIIDPVLRQEILDMQS